MSWRRFCVLMAGLSGNSRLADWLADDSSKPKPISDPKAAMAAVDRILR